MTEPLLEVTDLCVDYLTEAGDVRAVDRVSLTVGPGEFLGIVGESGCGKSTLLFSIARLLSPPGEVVAGSVSFRGKDMVRLGREELRQVRWRDFSVVMQSAMNALNPMKSIGAQFKDAYRAHSDGSDVEIQQRSEEVLGLVGIDSVHLRSYPHQLSGGMRQRAMIAMALLFSPSLVMMDEPTSALDVVAQRSLMTKIKELQRTLGFAVIFVTHDMSVVSRYSDRVIVMYAGQVAEAARTEEIFDRPLHPYTRGLMSAFPTVRGPRRELTGIPGAPPDLARPPSGCRFHPRCPDVMPHCPIQEPELFEVGGARVRCLLYEEQPAEEAVWAMAEVARSQPAAGATSEEPLLRVVDLTRHFGVGGMFDKQVLHAVDDFNFSIGEREIVALVGESGSGKSTIARLLARVFPPTRGEIYYRGRPVHSLRSRRSLSWYRSEVSMVFQDPFSAFHPVHRIGHGVMRNLVLHRPDLDRAGRQREAERAFESVGLSAKMLRRYPYEMSGGERQRVGFAQALAIRPKLILADEPVSMLDVSIRAGVLNMMASLRDQEGVSILYITHDIASARYVADRVIVMYAGHLVEEGPTETVLSDPKHPYTQLLLSAVADPREKAEQLSADTGEPPRVINPSDGCRFRWRCPHAIEKCSLVTPRPEPIGVSRVACHVALAEAAAAEATDAAPITHS